MMSLTGDVFRKAQGRITQRIQLGNADYFIKQHTGIGWKEIFKNLILGRLPICSAKNEWQAIHFLQSLAIKTLTIAAYGCRYYNPAKQQSFLLTHALPATESLETVCYAW